MLKTYFENLLQLFRATGGPVSAIVGIIIVILLLCVMSLFFICAVPGTVVDVILMTPTP